MRAKDINIGHVYFAASGVYNRPDAGAKVTVLETGVQRFKTPYRDGPSDGVLVRLNEDHRVGYVDYSAGDTVVVLASRIHEWTPEHAEAFLRRADGRTLRSETEALMEQKGVIGTVHADGSLRVSRGQAKSLLERLPDHE